MIKKHNRRDTCRLCGQTDLAQVLSLEPTPPANAVVPENRLEEKQARYPLDIFFCNKCYHVQMLDVIDPAELFEDYVYVSGTSPVFVAHFREYADYIVENYNPNKQTLIFDIGSNDGTFLNNFKEKGFPVLGIDPAQKIASQATARGIETLVGFFDKTIALQIRDKHGLASVISANNVFAHIDDLNEIIEGVKVLLAKTGIFVFEVSYLVDVFEKTLFDTIYHEHLAYHAVNPLIAFFSGHKMDLIDTTRVNSHGGSIRGIVQNSCAGRPVFSSVSKLSKLEKMIKLDRVETYYDFAERINNLKKQLLQVLINKKAIGKKIAAFGAPAKATTLMYHFGIGPEIIDFIVDDNPLKQGLYSPGMHIPIVSSAAIYEKRPDYIIILAWNFAESIMEKHRAFQKAGGQFIVPLPQVAVY